MAEGIGVGNRLKKFKETAKLLKAEAAAGKAVAATKAKGLGSWFKNKPEKVVNVIKEGGGAVAKGYGAVKSHGKTLKWIIVIIIIIFIIIGSFLIVMSYSQSTTGQLFITYLKQTFPGISNLFDKIKPTTNLFDELIHGTYDPTNLWTAELVQSDYAEKEELNFVIQDIHPAKNFFYPKEELQIKGKIDVSGGIREGTPVKMSFGDSCPLAANCDDRRISSENWKCYISGSEQENVFEIARVYNRIFYCNNPGISSETSEVLVYDPTLRWDYETSAVATKQIYVASEEVMNKEQDLVKYFNIDEKTLAPWYLGEEKVNIGMGLDQSVDFVQAYSGGTFKPVYLIGVSIENKGSGNIVSVDNLNITFPSNTNVHIKQTNSGMYNDFENERLHNLGSIKLVDYALRTSLKNKITESNPIKAGEHQTFYIAFWVDQAYLKGSSYQSFIVKVTADYTYRESEKTTITIKPAV